ncbi:MAG: hypothetical protein JNL21_07660 [Myxococcales bacterium]|nr:hypothetical protein [Myxococcales bacterium]
MFVTAEPSEGTRNGFTTADGWFVRFERFVTAVGDVDLDGPAGRDDTSCNSYSEANYERLFDFTVLERSKVAVVYGLGECSVEWRARGPSSDTVLGAGATDADVQAMVAEGTTLVVQGVGVRQLDGLRKSFSWVLDDSYDIDKCATATGDGYTSVFELEGGESVTVPIVVSGEELFRLAPEDGAPILFDPFASGDLNDDGAIELEELKRLTWTSFDYQYLYKPSVFEQLKGALPRISRVAGGGPCEYELRDRR